MHFNVTSFITPAHPRPYLISATPFSSSSSSFSTSCPAILPPSRFRPSTLSFPNLPPFVVAPTAVAPTSRRTSTSKNRNNRNAKSSPRSTSKSTSTSNSNSNSKYTSQSPSRSPSHSTSRSRSHPESPSSSPSSHSVDIALGRAERLHKVLSRVGVASRRVSESMIADGKVSVNGRRVTELGTSVDVWKDKIRVNGTPISIPTTPIWLALNKPRGYLSTISGASEDQRRASLYRLLFRNKFRIHDVTSLLPVGVIEEDASGLVLVTNERGAITDLIKPTLKNANRHVQSWYVDCINVPTMQQMRLLNSQIFLDDDEEDSIRPVTVVLCSGKGDISINQRGLMTRLEVRVRDGRHRVVRRLCEKVGLTVLRLCRRGFGPVLLGSLRGGECRALRPKEIKALKRGVSERTVKTWN